MSQPQEPNEIRRNAAPMGEVARSESVRVTDDGITEIGFDDPELRPLPPDKLHYHVPHPDPHPEAHEHSDVPIRPLAITLAAIAGTCLLSGALLYWVFWSFKSQQEAQEVPRTGVPVAKPTVPEPRLQGVPGFSDNHPTQDMVQMRARYQQELNSYGANGEAATARIPIDRAMELALERKMFPTAAPGQNQRQSQGAGTNVQGATTQQPGPRGTQQRTQQGNPQGTGQSSNQQNNPGPTPRGPYPIGPQGSGAGTGSGTGSTTGQGETGGQNRNQGNSPKPTPTGGQGGGQ